MHRRARALPYQVQTRAGRPMQSGRFYAILSLIAPMALPTAVLSQGSSGAQLFTSFDSSLPGAGRAGFAPTGGGGSLPRRGSFGLSYSPFSTAPATTPREPSRWTGDVDLILPDRAF